MSDDDIVLEIPFTQYLLPYGRLKDVSVTCKNPETYRLAQEFLSAGGRFGCEVLTTGHVSLTAVYAFDEEEEDCAIEVCNNGAEVPDRVDRLVATAHRVMSEKSR